METVLLVNFQDRILLDCVRRALLPLRLNLRVVEPAEFDRTIAWLADGGNDGKGKSGEKRKGHEKGRTASGIQAVTEEGGLLPFAFGMTAGPGMPGMRGIPGAPGMSELPEGAGTQTLAGLTGPEELSGEMLVFAGISGGRLDETLAALREKKLRIPYKAVMTAVNRNWTVRQLHREIRAEHEAMTGRKGPGSRGSNG